MNSYIIAKKKALRTQQLSQRNALDPEGKKEMDAQFCNVLANEISSRGAQTIHTYLPMGSEINLWPLIQQLLNQNKRVICPKTLKNRTLENRVLHSLQHLENGVMNTQYPAEKRVYTGPYDVIIVPGLAFDKQQYRLGYGGGYYDAFLSQHPNAYTIGAFYKFQEVTQVPKEAHDFKLDQIICL